MTTSSLLRRLQALETARPPIEAKPVDMRSFHARMNLILIAYHHGGKQPGESYLTGFARALKFRDDAALFNAAWNDREEFCRRYAVVSRGRDEAGDLCTEVIRQFIAEELAQQAVDAMFPFWRRPGVEPVDVDDEVISDIGRDLLTLAARRARPLR